MIKVGLVGLGKMGISHCAIVNAQKNVELVAVCESSAIPILGQIPGDTCGRRFF